MSQRGNGFVFERATPSALLIALARALEVFRDPAAWRRLQENGMREDHSWTASAESYVQQYWRAAALRRQGAGAERGDADDASAAPG